MLESATDFTGPIIFILVGTFSILASVFDWDFFFSHPKTKFFVSIFGRTATRYFYVGLGFFMFFAAFKILKIF